MLREAHISRLENRYGIPAEAARRFTEQGVLASVDAAEIARLCGRRNAEGGGILIRYPNAEEMFAVRLDVPRVRPNGRAQKYDRPPGLPPRLFVPPGLDMEGAEEVWITEGELKALAGAVRGLPVCALPGVYNWRRDADQDDPAEAAAKLAGPGGKAPDPEALIDDLRRDWSGKTVVLIYDSDITQEHDAWPAFPRLAEQLYARGAAAVKVVTLPAEPPLEGEDEGSAKTGLDDYLRRREARRFNAAAELRELIARTPEWVPTGGAALDCIEKVGTLEGLERYAAARLASGDPERMVRAAAAYYAAGRETLLQAALKAAGIRGEMAAAVKADGKAEAERIRRRQAPRVTSEAGKKEAPKRTIVSRFPPAAEVVPEDFPFPEAEKGEGYYDIRGGKVVRVRTERSDGEERERVETVTDTVVLLTRRLAPLERGAADEKWEAAWWENGVWVKTHLPADWLFDAGQRKWLIRAGVPVSSENAGEAVEWLHRLRCLVALEGAPVPTSRTVSRCGWHLAPADARDIFVLGREILSAGGTAEAEAGERAAEQESEPSQGDEVRDIIWAEDISELERQILASFGTGGNPERQREFLLEMVAKYPQAAFGVGCACAAPLLALARRAPGQVKMDVSGFTVAMVPTAAGRSRHQGKTAWQRIVASLFGWPEKDPRGRIRFADRTRVAMGVLFATSCDLPVHIEDVHLIARERKKDAAQEVDYLIHLAAAGMDRERGARGGGGRRTRYFRTVAFWTAETDVLALLPPGSGALDRALKLPPLLEEESDANRAEAERIERETLANYGHAGRAYLLHLLRRLDREGEGFLRELGEAYDQAVEILRRDLPTDTRRASAGRLAKRAALGFVGLALLLEALGTADERAADECRRSFLAGWGLAVDAVPYEDLANAAWRAVQSYVAANAERIRDLRETEKPPAPAEWAGTKTEVLAEGKRVQVIALREEEFARAVSAAPFNLDPEQAKRALAADGKLLTRTVRQGDREKKLFTFQVRMGDLRPPMLCFPLALFREDDGEDGEAPAGF